MSGRHLASYLFDAASLWGERPACADAARTYSYNDYLNEALRVAALLRRAGVEAGDRVCISAPKSFSLYASMFGALMLNACYVPIDYTVPAGRGRKIIADCAPAALITTKRNLERLLDSPSPEIVEHISEDLVVALIGARRALPAGGLSGLPPAPDSLDPSSPAYILYTSGSTGEPKGVVHTHLSAVAFVEWAVGELRIDKDDIIAQVASVSFDLSVFDVFGAVRAAAQLAPVHESAMISPITLCRAIAKAKATVLYCVPSLVLREIKSHELGWAELGTARSGISSSPASRSTIRRFAASDLTWRRSRCIIGTGRPRRMSAAITGSPMPTLPARTRSPSAKRVPTRSCLISGMHLSQAPKPASCWWRETR